MSVGYVYHKEMQLHRCETEDHPEKPDRVKTIMTALKKEGLLARMTECHGRTASIAELLLLHRPDYLQKLWEGLKSKTSRRLLENEYNSVYLHHDTWLSALWAAGCTIELMTQLIMGTYQHGVAVVRPPGHHAHAGFAEGFCLFGNVALAATIGAAAGKRVAIFDWDVHHGDGTQDLVEGKENIMLLSVQRHDRGKFYPGTGKTGKHGNIVNIGFNGTVDDKSYRNWFQKLILPELDSFKPDILIISAGFDAAHGDPLGGCHLTPEFYGEMTRELMARYSSVLAVLEGGYCLKTIAACMTSVTEALLGLGHEVPAEPEIS